MIESSAFGLLLRDKRTQAKLTQGQLAKAIGKTSQYIHNIEKGLNNAPSKQDDLERIVNALNLDGEDKQDFLVAAAADRGTLPKKQIDYISCHSVLADLIQTGTENDFSNAYWEDLLKRMTKDKGAEKK